MPRGGRRPNAGRPKGLPAKENREPEIKAAIIEAAPKTAVEKVKEVPEIAARITGKTPLQELLEIGFGLKGPRGHKTDWNLRSRCLAWAAPYIHPRQPQAIHVSGGVKIQKVVMVIHGAPPLPSPPAPDHPPIILPTPDESIDQ